MMAAAPIVFFIMREDPTTVPRHRLHHGTGAGDHPHDPVENGVFGRVKGRDHHRLQQMKPEKHYEQKLQTF